MSEKKKLINLTNATKKDEKTTTKTNEKLTAQERFILELEQKAQQQKKSSQPVHINHTEVPNKKVTRKNDEKAFRIISKITPQKRKGRYNIFINDEFAFGVDEEVLIQYELKKGLHVTKELQTEIESEESYYKAYQRTLNYLTYSLRSEKQIRDYLKKHDAEQYSERMIEHFKRLKLIDDLNYAESYVRTMANVNQKGPQNVAMELKQKGISDADILTAMEEYSYEQQFENAQALAKKRWSRTKNDSQVEGIQKVKQYLVNKGYSFEIADEVLAQMDTTIDEEEEYQALVKQGERALRRYARKHEGYELTQRLQRYLYSKSFSSELIHRFIEERDL